MKTNSPKISYEVGFTGTQSGMSSAQFEKVARIVKGLVHSHKTIIIHHGDCIGADEDMHRIAAGQDFNIVIHPPVVAKKRAFCHNKWQGKATVLLEKPYIARNHDIVDASAILIATPKEKDEEIRSGTWATIRYAKKKGVPVAIIYPNGKTEMVVKPEPVNMID